MHIKENLKCSKISDTYNVKGILYYAYYNTLYMYGAWYKSKKSEEIELVSRPLIQFECHKGKVDSNLSISGVSDVINPLSSCRLPKMDRSVVRNKMRKSMFRPMKVFERQPYDATWSDPMLLSMLVSLF